MSAPDPARHPDDEPLDDAVLGYSDEDEDDEEGGDVRELDLAALDHGDRRRPAGLPAVLAAAGPGGSRVPPAERVPPLSSWAVGR